MAQHGGNAFARVKRLKADKDAHSEAAVVCLNPSSGSGSASAQKVYFGSRGGDKGIPEASMVCNTKGKENVHGRPLGVTQSVIPSSQQFYSSSISGVNVVDSCSSETNIRATGSQFLSLGTTLDLARNGGPEHRQYVVHIAHTFSPKTTDTLFTAGDEYIKQANKMSGGTDVNPVDFTVQLLPKGITDEFYEGTDTTATSASEIVEKTRRLFLGGSGTDYNKAMVVKACAYVLTGNGNTQITP